MKSSGLIHRLSKLITLEVETILVPVVATLSECSVDPEYRADICDGGIIQYLSKFLESENQVRIAVWLNSVVLCYLFSSSCR
jgi:hypothetical protein